MTGLFFLLLLFFNQSQQLTRHIPLIVQYLHEWENSGLESGDEGYISEAQCLRL